MDLTFLQELKNSLPRGAQKKIAEKTNFSVDFVSKVLKGQRQNELIITEAIKFKIEHIKKVKRLDNRIKKITNEFPELLEKDTSQNSSD